MSRVWNSHFYIQRAEFPDHLRRDFFRPVCIVQLSKVPWMPWMMPWKAEELSRPGNRYCVRSLPTQRSGWVRSIPFGRAVWSVFVQSRTIIEIRVCIRRYEVQFRVRRCRCRCGDCPRGCDGDKLTRHVNLRASMRPKRQSVWRNRGTWRMDS